MVTKICTGGISTILQNFIQIGSGVSFLRVRDFAPLGESDSAVFWVVEKGYRRDARTDFETIWYPVKYIKFFYSNICCFINLVL